MMPTYEFECQNQDCGKIWEDICGYSDPPEPCEVCGKESKRIMSVPALGQVELYGHDLKSKLKSDAMAMKREVYTNENALSNIVGPEKYQKNTVHNENVIKGLSTK